MLQTVLGGVEGGLRGLLLSVLRGGGGEAGADVAQAVGGILESMGGIEGLLKNVGGGGVGGGILVAIVGMIRK